MTSDPVRTIAGWGLVAILYAISIIHYVVYKKRLHETTQSHYLRGLLMFPLLNSVLCAIAATIVALWTYFGIWE